MARAKRLNAEKVTISIDSDVLLFAKHTALDLKMTLSDYIQSLVRAEQEKKFAVKSAPKKTTKAIISNEDKPAPELKSEPTGTIQIDADNRIMELKSKGITNREIAETLNNEGIKTLKGLQWNLENIKKRLQAINKAKGGNE